MESLIAASARRAITANQIDLAKDRYNELIRVGYKGGLFEATDMFLSVLWMNSETNNGWGMLIMDQRGHPIHLTADEGLELWRKAKEANLLAGRAYLMEYEKIVSSSKEALIKGDE